MSGASSIGEAAYKLGFQLSPIILVGGIATGIPGSMLPIIAITEAVNFTTGLLSGADDLDLNNFFANFKPIPGSSLIDNQIGQYPFANQAVAANAIIAQPLRISLLMECPVRAPFGYPAKLATMIALQKVLAQHNASGGVYTVATPVYFYDNCIMTGMRDVTGGDSKQVQWAYQIDFEQPLLTENQAAQAQNSLMSRISNASQISGQPSYSGLPPTVGVPPSLATGTLVPAASGASGSTIAGPTVINQSALNSGFEINNPAQPTFGLQ